MHEERARGTSIVSLAAILSVLAASGCCLPVLPFVAAAGFAGGSAFFEAARPYFLGASILLIGLGFWQARRARKCNRKPSVVGAALLWISTAFVAMALFFPQVMANAAADLLAR